MSIQSILAEIDAEIARLKQVRALLSPDKKKKVGGDGPFPKIARKKRKMSAEARKRIADAQKKRWAEQKKKEAK